MLGIACGGEMLVTVSGMSSVVTGTTGGGNNGRSGLIGCSEDYR